MPALEKKDVLVVDDDEAIRRLVCVALKRLKVSCETAVDGADALERITRTRYLVVLVDLMMPRVDGGEFVRLLAERENASTGRPIVLMMTAFPPRDRPELGLRIQAIIPKPFDVHELAELVRDCVEVRKAYESGEKGGDANIGSGAAKPAPDREIPN